MLAISALALALSVQSHSAHGLRPRTGRVLVVGAPSGFATIQGAIDQAEDGDVILVKSGSYSGFSIVDKGIYVTADAGLAIQIQGPVTVENLSAGKSVLLAGFASVDSQGDQPPFAARHDAGSVRVEQCTFGLGGSHDQPAALLDTDADVALVSCTLRGGYGFQMNGRDGGPGQPAMQAISSSVAIQDCNLLGGQGEIGAMANGLDGGNGGAGGDALLIADGFVYSSGSEFQGGAGGQGGENDFCYLGGGFPGNGGPGGSGIHVTSAVSSPNVVLLGATAFAGAGGLGGHDYSNGGGYPCWGDGHPGADGSLIDAPGGAVDTLAGNSRMMLAPFVAREGTVVTAHCYGESGDVVQILAGNTAAFDYVALFMGVELMSLPSSALVASGTIAADGALDLQFPMGSLSADAKPLFLQAYFRDPTNQRYAATQVTLIELDPRY